MDVSILHALYSAIWQNIPKDHWTISSKRRKGTASVLKDGQSERAWTALNMSAETTPAPLPLSFLEACCKHRPKVDGVPRKQRLCKGRCKKSQKSFLFLSLQLWVSALPEHELSWQPPGELSLKEFLLLTGSRPPCLYSSARGAPYCLDKLPNTPSGGCPITHPLRRVCHPNFVHTLFNVI